VLPDKGRGRAIGASVALAWLERIGDITPAQYVHIIGQCDIGQRDVTDVGHHEAEVDWASCGCLRSGRVVGVLPGCLAVYGDVLFYINGRLRRDVVVRIIRVAHRDVASCARGCRRVGVLSHLRGHRPIYTGVTGARRQRVGNRAAGGQWVDIVAQGDVAQGHVACVHHHKAEVDIASRGCLRAGRIISVLPGRLVVHRNVLFDVNARRLIEAGVPLALVVACIERDGNRRASRLISVAVARIIAALIAQGERVSGRQLEANIVAAGHQVAKEIVAAGVRQLSALRNPGASDQLEQLDGDALDSNFAGILDTIAIEIEPDVIADAAQPCIAEVDVGDGLADQSDGVRARCSRVSLRPSGLGRLGHGIDARLQIGKGIRAIGAGSGCLVKGMRSTYQADRPASQTRFTRVPLAIGIQVAELAAADAQRAAIAEAQLRLHWVGQRDFLFERRRVGVTRMIGELLDNLVPTCGQVGEGQASVRPGSAAPVLRPVVVLPDVQGKLPARQQRFLALVPNSIAV